MYGKSTSAPNTTPLNSGEKTVRALTIAPNDACPPPPPPLEVPQQVKVFLLVQQLHGPIMRSLQGDCQDWNSTHTDPLSRHQGTST